MTPTINPEEAIAIGAAIQGTKNYLLKINQSSFNWFKYK